jgi:hypothetical protein
MKRSVIWELNAQTQKNAGSNESKSYEKLWNNHQQ